MSIRCLNNKMWRLINNIRLNSTHCCEDSNIDEQKTPYVNK